MAPSQDTLTWQAENGERTMVLQRDEIRVEALDPDSATVASAIQAALPAATVSQVRTGIFTLSLPAGTDLDQTAKHMQDLKEVRRVHFIMLEQSQRQVFAGTVAVWLRDKADADAVVKRIGLLEQRRLMLGRPIPVLVVDVPPSRIAATLAGIAKDADVERIEPQFYNTYVRLKP